MVSTLEQMQVLCWLASLVAMFYGNLSKFGNKVKIGNKVQKCVFDNKEMSFTQRMAVISLIHKQVKKTDFKNYRPLSLTNVDYKVIATSNVYLHIDYKGL